MFKQKLQKRLDEAISMRKSSPNKAFWCGKVCAFREILRLYEKMEKIK